MRRGITPVVAIALLLGMTVVASGGAYAFFTTATESAMEDTTASLQTSTEVRDIQCTDTSVTVAISNTGDRELATDAATAYLYQDGELVDTVEKDLSGADVLQPGGFSQLEFPFTTYLDAGTRYGVEVAFESTDHTIERTCQAQTGTLIGYWNFDSISSRTILDAAGSNDGTFNGMDLNGTFAGMLSNGSLDSGSSGIPTWTEECAHGDCLSFDGSDDGVAIPHSELFNFGDGPFTISAWMKTSTDDGEWLVDKGNDGGGDSRFIIGKHNGGLRFYGDNNWQTDPVKGIFDGVFHHVSITRENTTLSVYIDGELNTTATIGASVNFTNSDELTIGQRSDDTGSHPWDGSIDDLRVYERALSKKEIQSDMEGDLPNEDVVAWYPMDEGSGQTVYNNVFQAPGQHGQAVQFDGSNDYIDVVSVPAGANEAPFTYSTWVIIEADTGENQYILSNGAHSGSEGGSLSYNDAADEIRWDVQTDGNGGSVSTSITVGEWHHLTGTWDGTTNTDAIKLYKDGALVQEGTATSQSDDPQISGLTLGTPDNSKGNLVLDGKIDQVEIYDRALSQSEIQEDMNGGAPQEGIVAYYSMDGPTGNTIWNNAFWREGKDGGALTFDGSDDWVRVPDSSELNPTRISYGAWFRPDSIVVGQVIKKCCVSGSSIWIRLNPGGNVSAGSRIDGTFQSVLAESVAVAGEWTHAFYTYNGSVARLYIDGELAGETPATGDVDSTTGEAVTIGSSQGGGNYFPGTIEDVRIYSSALTQEQVQALYNATN